MSLASGFPSMQAASIPAAAKLQQPTQQQQALFSLPMAATSQYQHSTPPMTAGYGSVKPTQGPQPQQKAALGLAAQPQQPTAVQQQQQQPQQAFQNKQAASFLQQLPSPGEWKHSMDKICRALFQYQDAISAVYIRHHKNKTVIRPLVGIPVLLRLKIASL